MKREPNIFDFSNWFNELKSRYRSISFSILFFTFVGVTNYFIGQFVDGTGTAVPKDILLDNIPVFPWGNFFVYGIFFFMGFLLLYPLFFRIKDFSYVFNQLSFMILIRNLFLFMTPYAVKPDAATLVFPSIINSWNFNNDLFFSGHAVVPMIGYLAFKDRKIKYFFLLGIALMAAIVILTHRHYTIDVFAGFFIGYGCYRIYNWISQNTKLNILKRG